MFFKGVLIDLDNTLYDYDGAHNAALIKALAYLAELSGITIEQMNHDYNSATAETHLNLGNTASSHNKILNFQKLCEKYVVDYTHLLKMENIYWETFNASVKLNENVIQLLNFFKEHSVKMCLITDYVLVYQLNKLDSLGILNYFNRIVSSEEVGTEKPNPRMFQRALDKLNLTKDDVLMLGDNYHKDILGAKAAGIYGLWFNKLWQHDYIGVTQNYVEFNDFNQMYSFFESLHVELQRYESVSRYCGVRFDLTQAGGGNTSFKINELLFIKASGTQLSEITTNSGYAILTNKRLKNDIVSRRVEDLDTYQIINHRRPSIETFMHSVLKKYTVHLHPIQVNSIGILKNGAEIFQSLFSKSLVIRYFTPGIELCYEILKYYDNHNIIFLLNHGVIFTTDDHTELVPLIESTLGTCEKYIGANFEHYKAVSKINEIADHLTGEKKYTYLSQNKVVCDLLSSSPPFEATFPDKVVYCGKSVLILSELCPREFKLFVEKYNDFPKIIVYGGNVYITSNNYKKCREIEDVLKAGLLVLNGNCEGVSFLSDDEQNFLVSWDAEKYRKNIE